MSVTWRLMIDSKSPGRAGFGIEGGQASEFYVPDGMPTKDDLVAFLLDTLGDVEIGTGEQAHKLVRSLPKAHPMYPWLFASRIEYQGVGYSDDEGTTAELVPTDPLLEAEPITEEYYLHVRVIAQVWFTPRPYALLSDAAVEPAELTYAEDDGELLSDWDSGEYDRFTFAEIEPQPQLITAQHGQLVYRTDSAGTPHGNTFSGFPTLALPDGAFKVTWFHVPYSLILDSTHPMHTVVGHVNQFEFFGRAAGSLLYLGAKARPYTPVVPGYAEDAIAEAFSAEKLCDITFLFQYTARAGTDVPTPANDNWIAAGWNLQPFWRTRAFHYVTAPDLPPPLVTSEDDWVPQFKSFPMEFLFRCP